MGEVLHYEASRKKYQYQEKNIGGRNMNGLYITSATAVGDSTVSLTFSDNTTQVVNVGEFIRRHPHPQYNKYLDSRKFRRFTIENGNIIWGKNWDLMFPIEQLHSGSLV